MILFYILLFIYKIRFSCKNNYIDYLSYDTTNAIKGIFIALVFITHAIPYVLNSGYVFDDSFASKLFLFIYSFIGQWIVAMFLFYSGYGVMESIQKKGHDYISSLPRKRILTTLVNFDIAVALFALVSLFTTNKYTIKEYLLSFIGWESVGNSNWYIFVIMLCYFLTYHSFRNFKGQNIYLYACLLLCLILFSVPLMSLFKPNWWYDTMLCFAAGVFYSVLRKHIEPFLKLYYWPILIILLLFLLCLNKIPYSIKGFTSNAFCLVFCLLIIMLSMKIKINNSVLIWAGKNLFPLYIYQRIPMIILSSFYDGAFVATYPVFYIVVCLLVTLIFTYFYKYWTVKL